jgi:SIR2-like protein
MTGLPDPGDTPRTLKPETWETLVDSVVSGKCTPFLGAGVAVPHLPTGAALAKVFARAYEYPLDDVTNLPRVTQYVASTYDATYVKGRVCRFLANKQRVTDRRLDGALPLNYRNLARLGLPLYITTNYDDYMQRALAAARGGVNPEVELCPWRAPWTLPDRGSQRLPADRPVVFHLHGHLRDPDSILLTDDDYVEFTASLAHYANPVENPMTPDYVRTALSDTKLLFIGYSLEDWNFRVLMRNLLRHQQILTSSERGNISIQLANRRMSPERRERAEKFLEAHLIKSSVVDVHWGDAGEFLADLVAKVEEKRRRQRIAS